jgi:hypothetical protein
MRGEAPKGPCHIERHEGNTAKPAAAVDQLAKRPHFSKHEITGNAWWHVGSQRAHHAFELFVLAYV